VVPGEGLPKIAQPLFTAQMSLPPSEPRWRVHVAATVALATETVLLGSATQSVDCWSGYVGCVTEQPGGTGGGVAVFFLAFTPTTMRMTTTNTKMRKTNRFFLYQGRSAFARAWRL
jgi:hypothetical protein